MDLTETCNQMHRLEYLRLFVLPLITDTCSYYLKKELSRNKRGLCQTCKCNSSQSQHGFHRSPEAATLETNERVLSHLGIFCLLPLCAMKHYKGNQ